jgi:hypothetical protein
MFSKLTLAFLLSSLLSQPHVAFSLQSSAESLAAQYSLSTTTTLPFPSSTQGTNEAQDLIKSKWSLGPGGILYGANDFAFVSDPFPNAPAAGSPGSANATGPVLQTTYPAGSYSHGTGGGEFYSLLQPGDGGNFQTMMVSYEVAFDSDFDWVKGGKLPGLRGGLGKGCAGGVQADGKDCFSTRTMWRTGGEGEGVYIEDTKDPLLMKLFFCFSLCVYSVFQCPLFTNGSYL